MKQLTTILTLFAWLTGLSVSGQAVNNSCDSIYDFVEIMPHYDKGADGLMEYLKTDLAPVLSTCFQRDSILTASIHVTLAINEQGKVIDVDFLRIQATEKCQEELRQKMMDMSGWTPGKQWGLPVCCNYSWPIRCINWK